MMDIKDEEKELEDWDKTEEEKRLEFMSEVKGIRIALELIADILKDHCQYDSEGLDSL